MRMTMSADDVGSRDGFAYWREEVCRAYAPLTIDREGDRPFHARVDVQMAGGIAMMDVHGSGYRMARSPGDIAAGPADFYLVFQVMENNLHVERGDERLVLEQGTVGIGDQNVAWTMRLPDESYRTRNFLVPRHLVDPWLAPGISFSTLSLTTQPGLQGLIADYVGSLGRNLPLLSVAAANLALENLGRLVAMAAGMPADQREAGRSALRAAKYQQAVDLIDRQFRDPDLSPERAAGLLGVSLRQLHLLFEHSGETFSQRLQHRRAAACRQALKDPALSHRSISDLAFDAGFDNLATFYRIFKRLYGMTPSDARNEMKG